MSFAHRRPAESAQNAGVSPGAGRPLFVPPGLREVRTGPTTPAELGRLLADAVAVDGSEVSQVRLRQLASPGSWRHALLRLRSLLGSAARRAG